MVVKLAAVLTIPFGIAKDRLGTPAALLVLTAFLIAGLWVTLLIDERRGSAVADAEDARNNPAIPPASTSPNARAT
jgi:hypothetical protein